MTSGEDRADYFAQIREQLRRWPYTLYQIDDTLDINLIEGRGKQLLFRAINARNLTAFAGSGLSLSYGRLSWRDWSTEQQRVVKRNSRAFLELARAALELNSHLIQYVNPTLNNSNVTPEIKRIRDVIQAAKNGQPHRHNAWRWLSSRNRAIRHALGQIEKLESTFNNSESNEGTFPGGEALPVKFEIAQQLHNQLLRHAELFFPTYEKDAAANLTVDDIWPGALIDKRNSAPVAGLNFLKERLKHGSGNFIPTVAELSKEFLEAYRSYIDATQRPESCLGFETLAKTLLVDERPHAMLLLRQGILRGAGMDPEDGDPEYPHLETTRPKVQALERKLDVFSQTNLKRGVDGIRENPELYRVLSPFTFQSFKQLRERVGRKIKSDDHTAIWKDFHHVLNELLKKYDSDPESPSDKRKYLTPGSRFLVSVYLALDEDPFGALNVKITEATKPSDESDENFKEWLTTSWDVELEMEELEEDHQNPFAPPNPEQFTSRRSIIADRFDPLPKAVRDLGIKQYITTNYDFEIERFFQDLGYRRFPSRKSLEDGQVVDRTGEDPDDFRIDGIGGVLRDLSFTRDRAADLTAFSVGHGQSGAAVYHLHGRATKADSLVVTERDYMQLYLAQDQHRETVDEGIDVTFSGAPLLFLGLGMEETDLLRPLRQFVSNRGRAIGHTAVALLPGDKPYAARTKFSSALYLRYGIHTVFYGGGQIGIKDDKEVTTQYGIDWLHRIMALISSLESLVETWTDRKKPDAEFGIEDRYGARKLFEQIVKGVGKVGYDLADENDLVQADALTLLFGIHGSSGHNTLVNDFVGYILGQSKITFRVLKTCHFTPVRPRKGRHKTETMNFENVSVDGDTYLGFYTALLDKLMKLVLRAPVKLKETPFDERVRLLKPVALALNGLKGAFLTGSLNAALDGIALEHQQWWKDWQESPPNRLARFQDVRALVQAQEKPEEANSVLEPERKGYPYHRSACLVRHWVDNVISPMDSVTPFEIGPDTEILARTKAGDPAKLESEFATRIRAFDTWIAAGASTFNANTTARDRAFRRIVTVAATRGLGKGTFLSAFSTPRGLALYRRAFWPEAKRKQVDFAGQVSVNLSFSPAIASVYDSIANALIAVVAHLKNRSGSDEEEAQKELRTAFDRLSRLNGLRLLFEELREASRTTEAVHDRLLISISGIELLFDGGKIAKNGEVQRFLDLLFGEALRDCPVDFVFVGDETGVGAPWSIRSDMTGPLLRLRMDRNNMPDIAKEMIARRYAEGRVRVDEEDNCTAAQRAAIANAAKPGTLHFVHFARPMNPVYMLKDNFQTLSLALYLESPPTSQDWNEQEKQQAANNIMEAAKEFDDALLKSRKSSDYRMRQCWSNRDLPTADEIHRIREMVRSLTCEKVKNRIAQHADLARLETNLPHDIRDVLEGRLKRNVKDAEEWRLIRRRLGNSRFALTILLAAAEHIIVRSPKPSQSIGEAVSFIREVVSSVRGIGQTKRDQIVLDAVLGVYRRFHVIGDPDLDGDLHMLLLRHMGVIGSPVTSAVLVRLPEIRAHFERVGDELEISRRRTITRALTTLAYRGLVFRLSPNPRQVELRNEDAPWDPLKDHRFALHRVVQSFALSKLDSGMIDPVLLNSFAPSLYSAIPSAGPRLSRDAYSFIRSLLIGLSQYPDVPHSELGIEPWIFSTQDTEIREQALRCAMTMVRSTITLPVISRLAERRPIEEGLEVRGHFETYRVRLRWIIRMAWELKRQRESDTKGTEPKHKLFALYRDEIVWLYNELGIVALAQGALTDALGFLRQAGDLNEGIEGRSKSGPVFNHIDLNHGIVQIERGQLGSARSRLERVQAATEDRAWKVHWSACGYLCVLDHLTGRQEGLKDRFRAVTSFFEEQAEKRAAAVFLMHRGRFLAAIDDVLANRMLQSARELAETGGHIDIAKRVELAIVKARLTRQDTNRHHAASLRVVQEVDTYGRQMGIWSLQVDAMQLHAEILLGQGETASSGRLLIRAMALARRHAMNLRLNSAMTLYARTLLARGDRHGATTFARASLKRAKDMGYNLETPRAQAALDAGMAQGA